MSADKRSLHRIGNKYGVELRAVLHFNGSVHDVAVRDFHALGVAVSLAHNERVLTAGQFLEKIEIFYGSECLSSVSAPLVVRANSNSDTYVISLNQTGRTDHVDRERRASLSSMMQGILCGIDPLSINQKLYFKVVDISLGGFKILSSKSNRHLVPGIEMRRFSLQIPGLNPHEVSFKIVNSVQTSEHLVFGCKWTAKNKKLERDLRKMIVVSTKPISETREQAREIRKIKKFQDHIQIGRVTTQEEMADVIKVRYVAYKAANKTKMDQTENGMRDQYDDHSVIYLAKIGSNIVGTMRLVIREPGKPLPLEEYLDISKAERINPESCAEVSRLAIDPAFQGTDLFIALFRKIIFEIGAKKIESPVCLATSKLTPTYQGIGALKIHAPVPHPTLPNETLTLLLFDPNRVIDGKMTALGWFFVAKPALKLMRKYHFIRKPAKGLLHYLKVGFELAVMKFRRRKK